MLLEAGSVLSAPQRVHEQVASAEHEEHALLHEGLLRVFQQRKAQVAVEENSGRA
jgi:hypothetical protein